MDINDLREYLLAQLGVVRNKSGHLFVDTRTDTAYAYKDAYALADKEINGLTNMQLVELLTEYNTYN